MGRPDHGSARLTELGAATEPGLALATRRARRWLARWSPVAVTIGALVAWSASRVVHLANADSLLPSLMSTQRLTWFFWGQDRLANVVPAIASPVRDVRWNISVQLFLIGLGWFTLASLFAAHHLARRRTDDDERPVAPGHVALATVTAGLATWAVLPAATELVFVFEQLYAFALVAFLVGMYGTVQPGWAPRIAGAAATIAAMLINPSLVLYTPFVAAFPGAEPVRSGGSLPRPSKPMLRAVGVSTGAFLLSSLAARRFGEQPAGHTGYDEFSISRSLANVADALANVGSSVRTWPALLLVTAAALWLAVRARTFPRRLLITYGASVLFGLGWTLLFSGNTWVLANALYPRYFFPLFAAGLLCVSAAAAEVVAVVTSRLDRAEALPRHRPAWLAAVPVVAGVAGVAIVSRVPIDTLTGTQRSVAAIRSHDVDLVVGGYWATWPVVIEARAHSLDVLGVESRSVAIADLIAERISHELAERGAVVVLCTDGDAASCTQSLDAWTPASLVTTSVLSDSPLVLQVGSGR